MSIEEEADRRLYVVVVNGEEQYSIWPKDKTLPRGWTAIGVEGQKADCLQHIEEIWVDMRPLSLRSKAGAG
jgi:MbtH protein